MHNTNNMQLREENEYGRVQRPPARSNGNNQLQNNYQQPLKRNSINRVPTKQLPTGPKKKASGPPPVPVAIKNKYGTMKKQGGALSGGHQVVIDMNSNNNG